MSTASRGRPTADRLWLVALASVALIVVGSITTWVSIPKLNLSASGTDGDSDGILTIIVAVIAGLGLLVLPGRRSIAAVCGVLALGVATHDIVQILQVNNPLIDINVGWGLVVVFLAAVALTISACLATPMQIPKRRTGTIESMPQATPLAPERTGSPQGHDRGPLSAYGRPLPPPTVPASLNETAERPTNELGSGSAREDPDGAEPRKPNG